MSSSPFAYESEDCRKKPEAIICDLDGTLCDDSNRRPFLENKNWNGYYSNLNNCYPIEDTFLIVQSYASRGVKVFFTTGRPSCYRSETYRWIRTYFPNCSPDELLMRGSKNRSSEAAIKQYFAVQIRESHDIRIAFDCRPTVRNAYRMMGIPTASPSEEREYPKELNTFASPKAGVDPLLPEHYAIRTRVDEAGLKKFGTAWGAIRSKIISAFNRERSGPSYFVLNLDDRQYVFNKHLLTFREREEYEVRAYTGRTEFSAFSRFYDDAPAMDNWYGQIFYNADVWEPEPGNYMTLTLDGRKRNSTFSGSVWDEPVAGFFLGEGKETPKFRVKDGWDYFPKAYDVFRNEHIFFNIRGDKRDILAKIRHLTGNGKKESFFFNDLKNEVRVGGQVYRELPPRTAERWVNELERTGYITRSSGSYAEMRRWREHPIFIKDVFRIYIEFSERYVDPGICKFDSITPITTQLEEHVNSLIKEFKCSDKTDLIIELESRVRKSEES